MEHNRSELARIKAAYAARAEAGDDRYSCFRLDVLLALQQRERLLLATLAAEGIRDLAASRVLDVGCGSGDNLRRFIGYGACPSHLHGVDLLMDRLVEARRLAPHIGFVCANAAELPYPDASFDICTQFTAFSSVLDRALQKQMAAEMVRVLRPGGLIVWYDFWLNPTNHDVRGIRPGAVRALFPGCQHRFRRLTLAPPIARLVGRRSAFFCQILERVPFLLSHYLAVIRPS